MWRLHKKISIKAFLRHCLLLFFFIQAPSYAVHLATCPTVNEIKEGRFGYWLPLYIEGEEEASAEDVAQFRKNVLFFAVARWDNSYLENGHCFYYGTHPIIQRITFAQDAWRPEETPQWAWVKFNLLAECYSNEVSDCNFIT